jgi:hypothetical protein
VRCPWGTLSKIIIAAVVDTTAEDAVHVLGAGGLMHPAPQRAISCASSPWRAERPWSSTRRRTYIDRG